jgi:glycerol kinase
MRDFLLGIDQGTSGSRAIVLDRDGAARGYGYRPLARLHPRPDWVEQDPRAVAEGVRAAIGEALGKAGIRAADLAAGGIASQRGTDFVWDARTGLPLANAITWQDLRTQSLERDLQGWAHVDECRRRLGEWPGPWSSALHLAWRLANDPVVAGAAREGRMRAGLSALWVLNALGHADGHRADVSLAQSMTLLDFRAREYWGDWLAYLDLPRAALPDVTGTVDAFGWLDLDSTRVPVRAMIADQQAALFGYDCRTAGSAECTHGTASFVDVCLGESAPALETMKVYLAWLVDDRPTFCLEADTTVTGAVVRWLRDGAGMISTDDELGHLAETVPDAAGLVFVPAFTGLNVPYDVRGARGSLLGLTLGHTRAHIARAFLDSIGLQVAAILDEIDARAGVRVTQLKVGGGLSASDAACAIQADWLGIPVLRSSFPETTARAAALLAGLGAGFWKREADLPPLPGETTVFDPRIDAGRREDGREAWRRAVDAVTRWAAPRD